MKRRLELEGVGEEGWKGLGRFSVCANLRTFVVCSCLCYPGLQFCANHLEFLSLGMHVIHFLALGQTTCVTYYMLSFATHSWCCPWQEWLLAIEWVFGLPLLGEVWAVLDRSRVHCGGSNFTLLDLSPCPSIESGWRHASISGVLEKVSAFFDDCEWFRTTHELCGQTLHSFEHDSVSQSDRKGEAF